MSSRGTSVKNDSTVQMRYDEQDFFKSELKPVPYDMYWIQGYNAKVNVINLNNEGSSKLFYAASNCGVVYNWTDRTMQILKGHRNMVTNISSDARGKWLLTADSGSENVITVWDAETIYPQRTLFTPMGGTKISRALISADAKYLLVLGYQDKAIFQWWIWSFGLPEPHAKTELDIPRDAVLALAFNPYNSEQFALITRQEFWIGASLKIDIKDSLGQHTIGVRYELRIRKPDVETNVDYGRLTCFTFVESTSQVVVGTTRGAVLIFAYTINYQKTVKADDTEKLRFVKALKIEKVKINVMNSIENIVLLANEAGEIHFYDDRLRLIYWLPKAAVIDRIKGISFDMSPRAPTDVSTPKSTPPTGPKTMEAAQTESSTRNELEEIMKGPDKKKDSIKVPKDVDSLKELLAVRDFVLSSHNNGIWYMDFTNERLTQILDLKLSHVTALSVHVEKPLMCVGFANGRIELMDFEQHQILVRLELRVYFETRIPPDDYSISSQSVHNVPELAITNLKYSPSGLHLACGLNTGELLFLRPTTIDVLTPEPFKDTCFSIISMCYSCDSSTLAFADSGRTVCVYEYNCATEKWSYIGKHRGHYKNITSLFFTTRKLGDYYRLFSIGEDRIMVEYDLANSCGECLAVVSIDRIDQAAVPLAAVEWPTPKGVDSDLPTILISNDQYKYKIINYDTAMTLATYLGPRYEHPVSKLRLIVGDDDAEQDYMIYATKNVIGLQKLPIDGNPYKHVGLMGHPVKLTDFSFRKDLGILFTIGEKDNCLCQWNIKYESVEIAFKHGKTNLNSYYCLLEGGRTGWLFKEMRDLFYYIQVLCQGSFSTALRRIGDCIPVDSLPDLMRALGFFPSQYEVENLVVEAKYKVYDKTPSLDIDFFEFVKLYINHRPAFGDNFLKIKSSFKNFAVVENDTYLIHRDDFIEMLNKYGECFSHRQSWYLLSILYGHSFEDRLKMAQSDFSFLPETISLSHFLSDIIGLQSYDNLSEQQSLLDSLLSQHSSSAMLD